MIALLRAVAVAVTVGGIAGVRYLIRWVEARTTLPVEVPDRIPVGVVAAVNAEDAR